MKNTWKLRNWPRNWQKTLWQMKNMVELVQQHKQIDHLKSSNVEDLHYCFNKIPKSPSQKDENMKSCSPNTCCDTEHFVTWFLSLQTKITMNIKITHRTYNHHLISYWFYSIIVFSAIFGWSLIIENVLDIQTFFPNISFSYQWHWQWFQRI